MDCPQCLSFHSVAVVGISALFFFTLSDVTYGCTATPGVVFVDIGFFASNVKNLRVFVHKAELARGAFLFFGTGI